MAILLFQSCAKDDSDVSQVGLSELNGAITYSLNNGRMSFATESDLFALYDSLNSVIDSRIDHIVDSLLVLDFNHEEINSYLDSIEFDDYLPLKDFISGSQHASAFDAYFDALNYELEEDNIDFEYIDSTFLLFDPIWLAIFNSDWELIISDSLIDLNTIKAGICMQTLAGCCPIASGNRDVTFNNGNNRFITQGRFSPSWWTVVLGGPLGAGVAGLSNYNMNLKHQTRNFSGRWTNTRTNLRIDSFVHGRFQTCSVRLMSANNRTCRNRSDVSWTRTVHSGGLGVLFIGWDGSTLFDSVHLPTNFNVRTNLSY